jgi:hypothetical protein
MSAELNPTFLKDQEVCQMVANAHWAIATSENHEIANGFKGIGKVYPASEKLLLATIRATYGLSALKAQRVYDVLIDCNESVSYCVDYVRNNRQSRVYTN